MTTDWSTFQNWRLVLPPNRPTSKFLEFIKSFASSKRAERVAVLGCTPEIREVLRRLEIREVVLLEKNPTFLDISHTLVNGSCARESVVLDDWLNSLKQFESEFDLIFSDLTSGNVHYDKRVEFYTHISSALRSGGYFLDRILLHDFAPAKISELRADYLHRPVDIRTFNDFSSDFLFCSELCSDAGFVDSSAFYRYLSDYLASDPKFVGLIEGAKLVTPEDAIWWYGKPGADILAEYTQCFGETHIFDDQDGTVFSGRTKILVNGKK